MRAASRSLRLALLALAMLVTFGFLRSAPRSAEACAFLRTPQAYEADRARSTYSAAMDLAAVDGLFPADPSFGLPAMKIGTRAQRTDGPRRIAAPLLRSIGWVESNLSMAARSVPFQSTGAALVSFDCGHGIMQVTTGMTVPLGTNNQPTPAQVNTATHFAYNVAKGAVILAEKWNQAPDFRPIAGTDTQGTPAIIENWYFAVWAYNGFTGPGSTQSNHPLDPVFANPREGWRCDGTQSRTRYPYQELVWGCLNSPPVSNGTRLWAPLALSLPNTTLPHYFQPLSVQNWVFPYSAMDMPTPQPAHVDPPQNIAPDARARLLGAPVPAVSSPPIEIRAGVSAAAARASVEVRNAGSGILVWAATPSANWIVVDPPAGVSLGPDVACTAPCNPTSTLTVTVNPVLLPNSFASGRVVITGVNAAGAPVSVPVTVNADFELGASGTSRAY